MHLRASRLGVVVAIGTAVVGMACGTDESTFDGIAAEAGLDSALSETSAATDAGGFIADDAGDAAITPGPIVAVIRDFRFFDAGDNTTNPDFEHPPFGINATGDASAGYQGDWDDLGIVSSTLGNDGKPVYAKAVGKTVTTHGKAAFDMWYRDVAGTNVHVDYPLTLVQRTDGSSEYDSEKTGELYVASDPARGRGFFPIDDGTPFATAFGNQGASHNFSFTVEIHTVFTYKGGEYLSFRGDDDVFVFIDKKLVIDLGGIHVPRQAQVNVDSLGLTKGQTYPLDFFWAERHQDGSNVLFQTSIALQPAPR